MTVSLIIGKHEFRFDEEDIIGEGAMGIVYKGYEVMSGRSVAIKRIHDELTDNQNIRRRAHEEGNLGFAHPNLVEMLGCCEDNPNFGPMFLVSGYVNGENINVFVANHIDTLHLPAEEREHRICELFIPVLEALAFLHSHNIRHLDIKPANIMVENGRNVRLMDLGIVDSGIAHQGIRGRMIGTPRYAAPEQFAASNIKHAMTPATDVYQAGVTLYTLLAGANPFPGDIAKACLAHQSMQLPKTAGISKDILAVVQKAARPRPHERYQTAEEMKKALTQAIYHSNTGNDKTLWPWIIVLAAITILAVVVIIAILQF